MLVCVPLFGALELEALGKFARLLDTLGKIIRVDEAHGRCEDFTKSRHRLFFYDPDQAEDAVQVVTAVILDRDVTFFFAMLDRDARG